MVRTYFTCLFYVQPFTENRFTNAYDRLTSQSPDKFWTSGQWMTERKGGSDVGKKTCDGTRVLESRLIVLLE